MTRPPARWADCELPEELSRLIAGAAPSHHDDAAIARMHARLQESLGPAFRTRAPGSSAASRVLSWVQRGKWLCAAVLATAGFSFVALRSSERAERASASHEAVRTGEAEATAHVRAEPARQEPNREPEAPTATARAFETHRAEGSPLPALRAQAAGKARASRHAGSAATSGRAAATVQRELPAPHDHETGGRALSGLAVELQGLDEIRRLLHRSPARALAAVEAQQARFTRGALGPERELLRIEALLLMGRRDDARRRAVRALGASDNPPYREQIERLFAQPARSAGAALQVAADGGAKPTTREQAD